MCIQASGEWRAHKTWELRHVLSGPPPDGLRSLLLLGLVRAHTVFDTGVQSSDF